MLHDPQMALQFMSFPPTPDWVAWVGDQNIEAGIFDPLDRGDEEVGNWSGWLARSVELDAGSIVRLVASRGGKLSSQLWVRLVIALNQSFTPSRDHIQLAMILASAQEVRESGRLSMLLATISKRDASTAETMLRQLLTVERSFRWMTTFAGDHAVMVFNPLWDEYSIREADSVFTGREASDYVSRLRPVIEEVGQADGPLGFLIEMLRDLLSVEVVADGAARTVTLLTRRSEVVRRVALFALSGARSEEADLVLNLLVDRSLLFDSRLRPEAFRALSEAFRSGSERARTEVVDHILRYVDPENDRWPSDHYRFDLLSWAANKTSDDASLNDALKVLKKANPTFEANDHADRNFWITTGSDNVEPTKATGRFDTASLDTLTQALSADRSIDDLLDGQETFAEVERFVENGQASVLETLSAFKSHGLWSGPLWSYLLDSIPKSSTTEMKKVVRMCLTHPNLSGIVWALSRYAGSNFQAREAESLDDLHRRLSAVLEIWRRLSSQPTSKPESVTTMWAVNTPEGQVASTYMEVLQQIAMRRGRRVLSRVESDGLGELVESSSDPFNSTLTVVTRFAGNLSYFSPAWFDRTLLPMFNPTSPGAERAWIGMLGGYGWNLSLRARLGDLVRTSFRWIRDQMPASVDDFLEHHSWLFLTIPAPSNWADNAFIQATESQRAQWIRDLGYHVNRNVRPPDIDHLIAYWRYLGCGANVIPRMAEDRGNRFRVGRRPIC
jgi:hypothetical protein